MQTYEQDIEKILSEGNPIQIKPKGYSMYPVLVPGRDEVIVEPLEERIRLKRGDVVLYRRWKTTGEKDILVLHRIWKVNELGIYLVGDNQKEVEGPLERSQMLGIAICIIRKGKRIPCANICYKFLTGLWLFMRPIRPVISKSVAFFKKKLRKMEHK